MSSRHLLIVCVLLASFDFALAVEWRGPSDGVVGLTQNLEHEKQLFVPSPDNSINEYQCYEWLDLEFVKFSETGSSIWGWSWSGDWSQYAWSETGSSVPYTIIFISSDAELKAKVLALADGFVDTLGPFGVIGELELSGLYENPVGLVKYGVGSEIVLAKLKGETRGHYGLASGHGLIKSELYEVSETQYKFYAEIEGHPPMGSWDELTNFDYQYTVILYDSDGWEVGTKSFTRSLAFTESVNTIIGEISTEAKADYIRVIHPNMPGG